MSTEHEGNPADDWSDSDRLWFEEATGQTPSAGTRSPRARMLREAIVRSEVESDVDASLAALLSEQARLDGLRHLRGQLRTHGVLAPAEPRPPWWRRWLNAAATGGRSQARWALPGGLAVAAVAALLIVPPLLEPPPDYGEPPTMKGEDLTIRRVDPNPRAAAETLAKSLRQAGLQAGIYQRGKTYFVDVVLAPDELDEADAALRPLAVKPKVGSMRIEFDRK